ncbi:MAG TPA: hypothetical protein VHM30_01805 [Gemmatimonadaceae bacterium]|nr:hypothetical protein [Gemmatimonadaceae bacterium]
MSRFHAALAAALLLPVAVSAQEQATPDTLYPALRTDSTRLPTDTARLAGRRVRIRLADGSQIFGIVRVIRGDTIVMRSLTAPGAPLQLRAGDLRGLDVQQPARSAARNFQIGALLGAVGGGVAYLNLCDKHRNLCDPPPRTTTDCAEEDDQWRLSETMILTGALVGGAIGYAVTPRRWRAVGVSVGGAVVPDGTGSARASLGARIPLSVLGGRPVGR